MISKLLLPVDNTREAAIVSGIEMHPAFTFPQVMNLLNGGRAQYPAIKVNRRDLFKEQTTARPDLIDVKGHSTGRQPRFIQGAARPRRCGGGRSIRRSGCWPSQRPRMRRTCPESKWKRARERSRSGFFKVFRTL